MLSRDPRRQLGERAVVTGPQSFMPEAFGEVLRRFRAAAGVSQKSLAERAGLSVHGISDLERGARRHPYPDTVRRLAEALNLVQSERMALYTSARRSKSAWFGDR
jgi:transcriptional regulator with XRE-family HTH domain